MVLRICFMYSVTYLLAFAIIPVCKANYDAQLEYGEKLTSLEEARMMGNKARPKMLYLNKDNRLNRPPKDNMLKHQSGSNILSSRPFEYYEGTPRYKPTITIATRKIYRRPTASFDDYTPRYRPVPVKRPKASFSRSVEDLSTGTIATLSPIPWKTTPRNIPTTSLRWKTKPEEFSLFTLRPIEPEKFSHSFIPWETKPGKISLPTAIFRKTTSRNIPTTSLPWNTKPEEFSLFTLRPIEPEKFGHDFMPWEKIPGKISLPTSLVWKKTPRNIPTTSLPRKKQTPNPFFKVLPPLYKKRQPTPFYYSTKKIWTSPIIKTFRPTAKRYPNWMVKKVDAVNVPQRDIEDADPSPNDVDGPPVSTEENADPEDIDAPSMSYEKDLDSPRIDVDSPPASNEEDPNPILPKDIGALLVSTGEDSDSDSDNINALQTEEDPDPDYNNIDVLLDSTEEDSDVSVNSDESKPLAVTRCTTSKPLPKLNPNFLLTSSEENDADRILPLDGVSGDTEKKYQGLNKYRAPNEEEPPHNYIDDEK